MGFYERFLLHFPYEPTPCQDGVLRAVSSFLSSSDGDILVVNGYAGTGKTTAVGAIVADLEELGLSCVLLAPTGRSARVLSLYAGHPASTIHKHIYRQKSFGADGFGQFSLSFNKARNTLFIVDEVSLIGLASEGFGSGNLLEDLVTFVRSGLDEDTVANVVGKTDVVSHEHHGHLELVFQLAKAVRSLS